jgi:hypothetical protein
MDLSPGPAAVAGAAGGRILPGGRRKQRNARLGGELAQHTSASPRGISDPGQRARLDDLRKKFEQGVREYRSRGKDLYKLPWYAIVGEPGSGKTEAIRHSNVGFPPGMQDEFQGVGGTINMNWWFTNHAVLLDTAGRLMFEEVKPGETSEWKEFLTLLKKNRPNCPINGLFLVVPSDSLIKDTADDIQKKAGKIAQQLDVIQRVLDVRFPVFIIVTKCDKVNGFREFFDGLTDPQLQHQMMGWSNPAPLDEPFRPDLVDQHLNQVAQRLRKRRLGLMRDPVPENPNGRRTDEVDSLYALPHSLALLAPRLRRYLETIFIAGEWSAKPLFLRGIYFSSSMREGAALDEDLAEAIGVPVDDLPEGKVWERERAYFLRDLFIEKVFRERGLVTRASNTARMLRGQQVALYGFAGLALLLFVVLAWYGTKDLDRKVKRQSDSWVAATNWLDHYIWKQSIIAVNPDGSFGNFVTNQQVGVAGERMPVGRYHAKLRDLAQQDLPRSWLVPGLARTYNRDSKQAQRVVFEGGVIKPLVEASRQKMIRALTGDASPQPGQAEALATLVRLEGDILSRNLGANKGEVDADLARDFLSSLLAYVAPGTPLDPNLAPIMVWTYSENSQGRGKWPPAGLSGAVGPTNTLSNNPPLQAGLNSILKSANVTVQIQIHSNEWNLMTNIAGLLTSFQTSEDALFKAANLKENRAVANYLPLLSATKDSLDALLAKAKDANVFQGGISLTNASKKFWERITASSAGELLKVRSAADKARAQCAEKDQTLFNDIRRRLDVAQADITERVQRAVADDLENLKRLDEVYLADPGYAERGGWYKQLKKLEEEQIFQSVELIGVNPSPWTQFVTNRLEPLKNRRNSYGGQLKADFASVCDFLLKHAEAKQHEAFFDAYRQEANKKLGEPLGFPLVKARSSILTLEKLKEAEKQLIYMNQDFRGSDAPTIFAGGNDAWLKFAGRASNLILMAEAILGREPIPGDCTISLMKSEANGAATDKLPDSWRDVALICAGAAKDAIRYSSQGDQKMGAPRMDATLTLKLIQNVNAPNPKTSLYPVGEWGALALLLQTRVPPVDRRIWTIHLPLKEEDGRGAIPLKLEFDRPFPKLEDWPPN